MQIDTRELTEYPFDGVFYELLNERGEGLLDMDVKEVEILRTKCDIQQATEFSGQYALVGTFNIYFPLLSNVSLIEDDSDNVLGDVGSSLIDDKSYKPICIKRGMYFRGEIYGCEVNGKVTAVAPSMLGGCFCQVKDVDE